MSRALAHWVFGSLATLERLDALEALAAEDGHAAFFAGSAGYRLYLEYQARGLGEPRPTSLDAYLDGPRRVAVEVKLSEAAFGGCSRPRMLPANPRFQQDHCVGSFSIQRGRRTRCSLSERGILYWRSVPEVFCLERKTISHVPWTRPTSSSGTYSQSVSAKMVLRTRTRLMFWWCTTDATLRFRPAATAIKCGGRRFVHCVSPAPAPRFVAEPRFPHGTLSGPGLAHRGAECQIWYHLTGPYVNALRTWGNIIESTIAVRSRDNGWMLRRPASVQRLTYRAVSNTTNQ